LTGIKLEACELLNSLRLKLSVSSRESLKIQSNSQRLTERSDARYFHDFPYSVLFVKQQESVFYPYVCPREAKTRLLEIAEPLAG
jgi:hypothetical protein